VNEPSDYSPLTLVIALILPEADWALVFAWRVDSGLSVLSVKAGESCGESLRTLMLRVRFPWGC